MAENGDVGNVATGIEATGHFAGCAMSRGRKQNQVEQLILTRQEIGFASIAGIIIMHLEWYAIDLHAAIGVAGSACTVVCQNLAPDVSILV